MIEYYVTPELNQKETLSLSLTDYEAKLIKYELEQLPLEQLKDCLLYTSPSPRDRTRSRMPSSA